MGNLHPLQIRTQHLQIEVSHVCSAQAVLPPSTLPEPESPPLPLLRVVVTKTMGTRGEVDAVITL